MGSDTIGVGKYIPYSGKFSLVQILEIPLRIKFLGMHMPLAHAHRHSYCVQKYRAL